MILTVRSERATEQKFPGAKWPGNERARERVGQGANRPEFYWPIRSGERIGPGAKRLGTISGGRGGPWGIFFGFSKTRHILLSNSANCTVLRAVVLTQYGRVTAERQTHVLFPPDGCTAISNAYRYSSHYPS